MSIIICVPDYGLYSSAGYLQNIVSYGNGLVGQTIYSRGETLSMVIQCGMYVLQVLKPSMFVSGFWQDIVMLTHKGYVLAYHYLATVKLFRPFQIEIWRSQWKNIMFLRHSGGHLSSLVIFTLTQCLLYPKMRLGIYWFWPRRATSANDFWTR